jgi:drug/metabolite transporter (DMT)-like permease
MHATWSSMAYRFKDQVLGFAMMGWVSIAFGLVLILASAHPARASWGWIACSVLLHVVYTVALVKANGLAQFSQIYPISRGLAPVLVASLVLLGVGDQLTGRQVASVAVIVVGLMIFASVRAEVSALGSRALPMAIVVSVLIAAYTVVDGLGVRQSGSVLGYTGFLSLGQGVLTVAALQTRGGMRERFARNRALWKWSLAGGLLASGGYATTIWAQQHGTLAVVAALRETSILFATIIGVLVLREGASLRRVLAATVVVSGIVLLHLG